MRKTIVTVCLVVGCGGKVEDIPVSPTAVTPEWDGGQDTAVEQACPVRGDPCQLADAGRQKTTCSQDGKRLFLCASSSQWLDVPQNGTACSATCSTYVPTPACPVDQVPCPNLWERTCVLGSEDVYECIAGKSWSLKKGGCTAADVQRCEP